MSAWIASLCALAIEPWSHAQHVYALVFSLGVLRVCCLALMMARLLPLLPAWNRACKKTLGEGWLKLALDQSSAFSGHPGGSMFMILLCALMGVYGVSQAIGANGAEQAARWAAMSSKDFLSAASMDGFYALLSSVGPLFVISGTLKTESGALGERFQEEAGFPAARERAKRQSREIESACAEPTSKGSSPRL